jgi:hypothetical protein
VNGFSRNFILNENVSVLLCEIKFLREKKVAISIPYCYVGLEGDFAVERKNDMLVDLTSQEVMLSPPSSGRCWDADAAYSRMILDV